MIQRRYNSDFIPTMVSLAHLFLLSGCTLVINGQYAGIPKCAVPCAKTDCLNAFTPPGECCPVCPSTPPQHCAAVLCPKPDCLNPTTPPGECCPVCLATIPKCTVPCAKTDCLNAVTPPGECCPVCPSTPPPHCAAVLCPIPDCLNPSTPPGECCPVCLGKSCFHKGVRRQDGETFKDDCNTCTCNNGRVVCTKIGCIEKPGKCPGSSGFGKCAKVSLCSGDSDCPGSQKCCSSKCGGSVCMPPVIGGNYCYHKGVRRQDGETFKDDCNTCTCNNGRVACTKIGCSTCGGIKCPQLRCANQYTPPGQCCAVCRPPGKPDIYAG